MSEEEEIELRDTIELAILAHGSQLYGQLPYAAHLALVARHFTDYKHVTVAWLHDIVEDTKVTVREIEQIYGKEIAEAVDAITRRGDEPYLEIYIPRVARNSIARAVKIADLQENIWSATHWYPSYSNLLSRYKRALSMLNASEQLNNVHR